MSKTAFPRMFVLSSVFRQAEYSRNTFSYQLVARARTVGERSGGVGVGVESKGWRGGGGGGGPDGMGSGGEGVEGMGGGEGGGRGGRMEGRRWRVAVEGRGQDDSGRTL